MNEREEQPETEIDPVGDGNISGELRAVKFALGFALFGFAAWVLYGLLAWLIFRDWSTSGQFGDTFGALNSMVSGLALIGIVVAIFIQSREFRLQVVEFRRTAEAQERSASALSEQAAALRNATAYQAFGDVTEIYREPAMREAVKNLWDIWRRYPGEEFHDRCAELLSYAQDNTTKLSRPLEGDEHDIDNHRRLVSQFYAKMAILYVSEIMPGELIYSTWDEDALRIIPLIIVPLENLLLQILRDQPKSPLGDDWPPMVLYRDSINR